MARRFSLPRLGFERLGLGRLGRRGRLAFAAIAIFVALILLLTVGVGAYTDRLWFSEVGFTGVWSTVLITRITLFVVFAVVAALVVGGNIALAYRLRPSYRPISAEQQNLERYRLAITPRFGLIVAGVSTLVGVVVGLTAQAQWRTALLFFNSEPFGVKDPQFGKDISFYVFQYPFLRYGLSVLFTTAGLAIIGALVIHYLYGNLRLRGDDPLSSSVIGHLSGLLGAFVLLKAVAYYFDRYGLLTSGGSADRVQGASAVDVEWLIPAKNILMWIAALCALAAIANVGIRRVLLPAMSLVLLLISAVIIGGVVPALASQFKIKPNAIDAEAKYIGRNINYSRKAYGIDQIQRTAYTPQSSGAPADIRNDQGTIPNARLLDPSVLSDTFVQRQQVRSFYDFNAKLDVDRYTVNGKVRDYVVGTRELNSAKLSESQRTWINLHTVFTHGNGFVAAPANQVDGAGLPIFASGALGAPSTSEQAREFTQAAPVRQPRIYYGELMNDYSIVGKNPGGGNREFDRPTVRGDGKTGEQISNTYDGSGGVKLDSFGRRLAYAAYFKEKNFLLSGVLHNNSKVLYVRNPRSRVEKVAPFLTLDADSYPAIVGGKVVWIIDGYTTSNAYPYSQHQELGESASDSLTGRGTAAQANNQINYIRNSVKATVDAYDGTVKLYQWDTTDPILKAWNKAFGGVVEPKSKIPPQLAEHFRYPEDMFKVQRQAIASYHVGNPREFFNGQGFWKAPDDPTQRGRGAIPAYYLVSQWPNQKQPRFQLTSPMTAARRENLAALISASYDESGRPALSVLELPGDSSTPGPNQAQPSMRNDATVRRELSLLTSADSTVVYGNLLTLPVGQGLLYIEPIYVRSTGTTTYPLLERVLVLYGDKVAYEKTLPQALDKLFGEQSRQPDQQPPGQSAPQPSAPEKPGQANPKTAAAVADIKKALDALRQAQQKGDFTGIGQAQSDLDAAVKRFNAAEGGGGGS